MMHELPHLAETRTLHQTKDELNAPFFIIGSGRSGTTLLRLMISGHPKIEIPPETWFILPLVRAFPILTRLTNEEASKVIEMMTTDYRWPDMGIPADSFRNQVMRLTHPTLRDIIDLVYDYHLETSGKLKIGDKTPPYIEIVPELSALYPGAKFIHLVRDGRDVAMSFIDIKMHGNCRVYERNFEWTRALRFRETYRTTCFEPQIIDIKYEDLIRDPETTLRKICTFLNVEFESSMLSVSSRIDRVPERERIIHPKLGEPLSLTSVAKWKVGLSKYECFIMEACLQRHLQRWGYALRYSSSTWKTILTITGWLLFSLGPILARGIPILQRRKILRESIYI